MGHAVDRDLLCLVQDEVKDLIKDYNTIHSQLNLHNKQIAQLEVNVATLTDQDQRKETRLVEHHKRLEALEEKLHVQQAAETRSEEIVFQNTVIDTTSNSGRKSRSTRANSNEDR